MFVPALWGGTGERQRARRYRCRVSPKALQPAGCTLYKGLVRRLQIPRQTSDLATLEETRLTKDRI